MSGIGAGLTGIQSGLERLGAAMANVTGSVAPGYAAVRVEPVQKTDGNVRTEVRDEARERPRDRIDISSGAVELMEAEQQVAVNAHALKRMNEMQGVLVAIGD